MWRRQNRINLLKQRGYKSPHSILKARCYDIMLLPAGHTDPMPITWSSLAMLTQRKKAIMERKSVGKMIFVFSFYHNFGSRNHDMNFQRQRGQIMWVLRFHWWRLRERNVLCNTPISGIYIKLTETPCWMRRLVLPVVQCTIRPHDQRFWGTDKSMPLYIITTPPPNPRWTS